MLKFGNHGYSKTEPLKLFWVLSQNFLSAKRLLDVLKICVWVQGVFFLVFFFLAVLKVWCKKVALSAYHSFNSFVKKNKFKNHSFVLFSGSTKSEKMASS